jgi:hypothetical protein
MMIATPEVKEVVPIFYDPRSHLPLGMDGRAMWARRSGLRGQGLSHGTAGGQADRGRLFRA